MGGRWLMPKILIESLSFPPESIESILINQSDEIIIHLSDRTLINNRKYEKWINICGTMDKKIVEQVSIGKNHYDQKFIFTCRPSIGLPGKIATNLHIILKLVNNSLGTKRNQIS